MSSCKVPVILVRCSSNTDFLERFYKKTEISNFIKISPVGAEMFYADRRTGRQARMINLIVAFRNFENAPKKPIKSQRVRDT